MDMGKIVKRSVEKQGMLAWQFNTIGVSDGITMGSEGTSTQTSVPSQDRGRPRPFCLSPTDFSQNSESDQPSLYQECATLSSQGRS